VFTNVLSMTLRELLALNAKLDFIWIPMETVFRQLLTFLTVLSIKMLPLAQSVLKQPQLHFTYQPTEQLVL
jgi:hypothetical protein